MGAASPCSVWWHSEVQDWDVVWRRGGELNLLLVIILSIVIAGGSGVA